VYFESIQRPGLITGVLKKYTENRPGHQCTHPSIYIDKSLIYALYECIYEEVLRQYT
jgi:hypothetical protein